MKKKSGDFKQARLTTVTSSKENELANLQVNEQLDNADANGAESSGEQPAVPSLSESGGVQRGSRSEALKMLEFLTEAYEKLIEKIDNDEDISCDVEKLLEISKACVTILSNMELSAPTCQARKKKIPVSTRDIGTQTYSEKELEEVYLAIEIKAQIAKVLTTNEVVKLATQEWPKRTFELTKLVRCSILRNVKARIVIVEQGNDEDAAKLIQLESIFSSIETFKGPNGLKTGEVVTIERKDILYIDKREENVHIMVLLIIKISDAKDANLMAEAVSQILKAAENIEQEEINVLLPHSANLDLTRKLFECFSHEKQTRINICVKGRKKSEEGAMARKEAIKLVAGTVVVKKGDKSFADTMIRLRSTIKPEQVGVEIQSVGKTKSGDVRVKVKEIKAGGLQTFLTGIAEKAQLTAELKEQDNQVAFLIRDLDEAVTTERIKAAIEKYSPSPAYLHIGELRRNKDGSHSSVVRVDVDTGAVLLRQKRLKVGRSSCRLSEWFPSGHSA